MTGETGGRRAPRRRALAVLFACSTAFCPVAALAQSPFPTDSNGEVNPADSAAASVADVSGPAPFPETDPALRTGAITPPFDQPYEDDLYRDDLEVLDNGPEALDAGEAPLVRGDPTGIRLGTFLLRLSTGQTVNRETTRVGGVETERDYLGSAMRGSLTSDWSRHALTVTGEGTFERDLGGRDAFEPEGRIDADLRLDLTRETVVDITGGYGFEREDNEDPNAIGGASVQSGVHRFDGGLAVGQEMGRLRGLAGIGVSRLLHTDAELQDGSHLSLGDRDRVLVDGRLRIGYEISPALIPFVEIASGRTVYDDASDRNGYRRSSWSHAVRAGTEFDFGEKLRGEIGIGYRRTDYDDGRLSALDAVTFDGRTVWSPQRGTDVELALQTRLQDSTAPGESGWVEYDLTSTVTRQLRHNLTGRLTGGALLRDFPQADNETTWVAGAGLDWSLTPHLDLTGEVEYEHNARSGPDTDIWRAGIGLTMRR